MNDTLDLKEQLMNSASMLVVLWVCHLIGDWLFQNDWIADRKTRMPWVRALHVTIYCVPFVVLFAVLGYSAWALAIAWIWVTHFWIDSYKPLMWFRRLGGDKLAFDKEQFRDAFKTPRGFFVYVTYDQIFHLITLLPVAWGLAR